MNNDIGEWLKKGWGHERRGGGGGWKRNAEERKDVNASYHTLTIAVRGASQEFSKSWTISCIQFETTLKKQQNIVNQ